MSGFRSRDTDFKEGFQDNSKGSKTSSSLKQDTKYFRDVKKGEVTELLEAMKEAQTTRNESVMIESVKKVVAYMTMGFDMSDMYAEMVKACNTRNIVQKKLVYFYLVSCAEKNAEISLLAVNTLQNDCGNENPMIRGLALRSLCSLRFSSVKEYLIPWIDAGLVDASSYVRRTAVLGIAKLHKIAPDYVLYDSNLVNRLYDMMKDKDTQVITNTICALNEILVMEGGIAVNVSIVLHLLNRLKDFNEWNQCVVLDVICKYEPEKSEVYDILNLLEERLSHNNSAVVMAVVKIFLKITQDLPIRDQIMERVKVPLLTLMSKAEPEMAWACLNHLRLLTSRVPEIFMDDYHSFFCRFNDPLFVKTLKVKILTEIACEHNMQQILDELSEYVRDGNQDMAKRSIKAIGHIISDIQRMRDHGIGILINFLEYDIPHVGATTMIVMKDLLRRYPEAATNVIPELRKYLKTIDDIEATAAMVWMLGEYGDIIEESPYLLEDVVDNYDEHPPEIKLQLLTAVFKLFFKRPGECQPTLGRLLSEACDDYTNIDVHDRALLYYRLLRNHISEAKRVVTSSKTQIITFIEDIDHELNDKLFEEFNTLSVVYGMPSERFMKKEQDSLSIKSSEEYYDDSDDDRIESHQHIPDLIINLRKSPVLDGKMFQKKWSSLPVGDIWDIIIEKIPSSVKDIDASLSEKHILTIAAGQVGNEMKMYLFAQEDNTSAFFLLELVINTAANTLSTTFKAESSSMLPPFMNYFKTTMTSIISLLHIK